MRRVLTAMTALVVVAATGVAFAAVSRSGSVRRAVAAHPRRFGVGAALVVACAAAWILVSPLVAAAVPLLFAAVGAAFGPTGGEDLAEYAAASDRAGPGEPPWWPEFERAFRRECRRRERARRRLVRRERAPHARRPHDAPRRP